MAKRRSRRARLDECANAIMEQLDSIDEIKDELEQWFDGLTGTNLENSGKYAELEETIDLLESAIDSIRSGLDDLENVKPPAAR